MLHLLQALAERKGFLTRTRVVTLSPLFFSRWRARCAGRIRHELAQKPLTWAG